MRVGLSLLFAALSCYVGAMWIAQSKLEARASELRDEAGRLCMSRGNQLPSLEQARERAEQLAAAHGIQLSELEVAIVPIDDANDTVAGAQVQAKLGALGVLRTTGSLLRVRGHMAGKQWLWRLSQELEASCTLSRNLQRVLPPSAQEQLAPGEASDTPALNQARQLRDQAGDVLGQPRHE